MTTPRTNTGFPLYLPIEEVSKQLLESKNCTEYLDKILRLLIRDTPFKLLDLSHLHEEIQEIVNITYSTSTVRRRLYDLRKSEEVVLLDGDFSKKEDRVFQWTRGLTKVVRIEPELKKGRANPMTRFYSQLLGYLF